MQLIPVIAIDGPSASGKGTVASLVAAKLGFHYLDSGAIYRVLAVAVDRAGLDPDKKTDLLKIISMSANLSVQFQAERVLLNDVDVSACIRTESAGAMASRLAVVPGVRTGLLQRQRDFRHFPGLVADGRDMGSVVFPDSVLKVFLTANAHVRAKRRVKQIQAFGQDADFQTIYNELLARDKRDTERTVAPLKPCPESKVLDSSHLEVGVIVATICNWYAQIVI